MNDVDKLQKLRYLDMVICEALRLYPVGASRVNALSSVTPTERTFVEFEKRSGLA